MEERFEIKFLETADMFLETINEKAKKKIFYNIEKVKEQNDPRLLKKLDNSLWEFRTEYQGLQYRLIAFWDKRNGRNTLVVCTHGFIKKTDRVPAQELERARRIMYLYFNE